MLSRILLDTIYRETIRSRKICNEVGAGKNPLPKRLSLADQERFYQRVFRFFRTFGNSGRPVFRGTVASREVSPFSNSLEFMNGNVYESFNPEYILPRAIARFAVGDFPSHASFRHGNRFSARRKSCSASNGKRARVAIDDYGEHGRISA